MQASANGITLEYEEAGERDAPTILLIMGLATQLVAWPDDFVHGLAERGFHVVRFDNRDIGLSSAFESFGPVDLAQAFARAFTGKPIAAPYTLDDMAEDAIGLLDALSVRRAHIVGVSMGGMIAQIVAARHPESTLSLVSIMSTSGSRRLPPGKPQAVQAVFAPRPDASDRERVVGHLIAVQRAIGSPGYPVDEGLMRAKVERSLDRSYRPDAVGRQTLAILASGSRVDLLKTIDVPTLVIHGADDPLVPVEAGMDVVKRVPGAKLTIVPGMGHDLAPGLVPILVDAIAAHCRSVSVPA